MCLKIRKNLVKATCHLIQEERKFRFTAMDSNYLLPFLSTASGNCQMMLRNGSRLLIMFKTYMT